MMGWSLEMQNKMGAGSYTQEPSKNIFLFEIVTAFGQELYLLTAY